MLTRTEFMTPAFAEAATCPPVQQREFLAQLADSPFFKPVSNDDAFRDTSVFCLKMSGAQTMDFAEQLKVPMSLFVEWTQGRHLPHKSERLPRARKMIDLALAYIS